MNGRVQSMTIAVLMVMATLTPFCLGENCDKFELYEKKNDAIVNDKKIDDENINKPEIRWAPVSDIVKHSNVLKPKYAPTPSSHRLERQGPDIQILSLRVTPPNETKIWGPIGWGLVGKPTEFNITIENIGTTTASNIQVKSTVYDYFDMKMGETQINVQSLGSQENISLYWNWTPSYATQFHIVVNVTCPGDVNESNNNGSFSTGIGMWSAKYASTCEISEENNWVGDVHPSKWHISSSPENSNESGHSAPYAWYHGEETVIGDRYKNNQNITIVSPTIDCGAFTTGYYLHLLFFFHGSITDDGDEVRQYVGDGQEWETIAIYNRSVMLPQPRQWYYWYTDLDGDGRLDPPNEYGILIEDVVAGKEMKIKKNFVSDDAVNGLGFYFDDYLLFGIEIFYNLKLENLRNLGTTSVGEDETIKLTIRNNGKVDQTIPCNVTLNITNEYGVVMHKDSIEVPPLKVGQSQDVEFPWTPDKKGTYSMRIEIENGTDHDKSDSIIVRDVRVSGPKPEILVVDDDAYDFAGNTADDIMRAIERGTDYDFSMYYVDEGTNGPDAKILKKYKAVVWVTGIDSKQHSDTGTLTQQDITSLQSYLESGGSLWLISPELVDDLGKDNDFLRTYLHVEDATTDNEIRGDNYRQRITPNPLIGVEEDEIANGTSYTTSIPSQWSTALDMCDIIIPSEGAYGVFYQNNSQKDPGNGPFCAIRYDSGIYRTVFFSFEFIFISNWNDRNDLSEKVLHYLIGGLNATFIPSENDEGLTRYIKPGNSTTYTMRIYNTGSWDAYIENITLEGVLEDWEIMVNPYVQNGTPETKIPGRGSIDVSLTLTSPENALGGDEAIVVINVQIRDHPIIFRMITKTIIMNVLGMKMICDERTKSISVGGSVEYEVKVKNLGNVKILVSLTKDSKKASWVYLSKGSLMIDAYSSESFIVKISVPSDAYRIAGQYFIKCTIIGIAKFKNYTLEDSVNLTANIEVQQNYNLKIDDVSISPSDAIIDLSATTPKVKVKVTINNEGNGWDNATVKLIPYKYISPDGKESDWSGKDWSFGKDEAFLEPFERGFDISLTVRAPRDADAGEYQVKVLVIPENEDEEYGDSEVISLYIYKPDLAIISIEVSPDNPVVGEEATLKAKIENRGKCTAKNVKVTFYDEDENEIESETINTIEYGKLVVVKVKWSDFHYGEQSIKCKVDPQNLIPEVNEENNEAEGELIGYQPDLQISNINVLGGMEVMEGDIISVSISVKNGGKYPSDATNVIVKLRDEITEKESESNAISIGAGEEMVISLTLTAEKPGTHILKIEVDPDNNIKEIDEENNAGEITITVKKKEEEGPSAEVPIDPMVCIAAGAVIAVIVLGVILYTMRRRAIPPEEIEVVEEE